MFCCVEASEARLIDFDLDIYILHMTYMYINCVDINLYGWMYCWMQNAILETCKHFMDDVITARELSVQNFLFLKEKYFKLNEV